MNMRFSSMGKVGFFRLAVLHFLFFTTSRSLLSYASVSPAVSEKSILLELKASVADPSGVLSTWISTDSSDGDLEHCSWYGVVCGPDDRVSALTIVGGGYRGLAGNPGELSYFGSIASPFYENGARRSFSAANGRLIGPLPSVIAGLTEIRVLSLPFHEFGGEIPPEIWDLRNLEALNLEGNSFKGNLPVSFEGGRNLRVLSLGLNHFSGEIPDSLSRCDELEVLNLAGNQFRGRIPNFISMLPKLSELRLSSNLFEGIIPAETSLKCENLRYLDLSRNAFIGEIPHDLGNCQQLKVLLLFSNQLQGFIPATFGQLQKLEVLDVSMNRLTGPVPAELGNCTHLSALVLSRPYNSVQSVVDAYTTSTGPHESQSVKGNSFQGPIPIEVTFLAKLKVLWAPAADLKGEISSKWGERLEIINLSQNFLTGRINNIFGGCKRLMYLDLSSNKLTGQVDEKLQVPCMVVFDVSHNMLSGAIPRFNTGICPPVYRLHVLAIEKLVKPSNAYLSLLTSEWQTSAPPLNSKLAVIHNFGHNNFNGVIPSLPIAHSRLLEIADYAFLADGNKLTGFFPGHLFDSCHKLNGMFLKVSNNKLSGRIPVELNSMCRSLKFLDVSGNQIFGFVPQNLGNEESLVFLDLHQKDGHAEIPSNLGRLKYLYYYSFNGCLAGCHHYRLRQLIEISRSSIDSKNLTALVFNGGKLSLQIHSGVSVKRSADITHDLARRSLLSNSSTPYSSYTSNPEDLQSDSATLPTNNSTNSFNSLEIASIVSASIIFLVLLALVALFIYTRKYAPRGGSRVQGLEKKEITLFTDIGVSLKFQNVVKATENFSTRNCIGSGGFGATYSAEVSPGVIVAVKRLAVGRFHCVQQFHAEIKTLGRIRHKNLVTLIGYHASETEMFLIYNYLPGGNLEKFIQDRSTRPVSWKVLHKIALDIAHALAYLHYSCDPRVIHRDVKPSNILLDNEFNAYLSDFGLSRLLGNSETHATTGVEGTFGYLAPEYAMTCRVSEKSDVYSYGVVLLELLSDKRALDPSFSSHGDGFNIVSWGCMLLRQGRAKEVFTSGLWDSGFRDDLVEVLHLALKCTLETLSYRPTMKHVLQRLKQLRPVS